MIYQYPGVAMVVRIDMPQATFHSEIFGTEQALLVSSELPMGRMGPLYQYVPAPDSARQLMIKVAPGHPYPREDIRLELIQLPESDRNSARLAQAYMLLSTGLQTVHQNDTSTWAMKAYTLRNAASVFGQLGWEEMRLWSEFFAAHVVLHRVNDELSALDFARDIRRQAVRAGREEIELAALILESEAQVRAADVSAGESRQARYLAALEALNQVAELADRQGMQSERARAIYNQGLIHEARNTPDEAVARFRRALEVAEVAGDVELANAIRGTAAEAYERLGSTEGALGMLDAIQGEDAGGDDDELLRSLFEKGRLLNNDERYREAADVLTDALDRQRGSTSALWVATALEQAWALYSGGNTEESTEWLERALPRAPRSGMETTLARAYGSLANTDRQNRDFGRMAAHREEQGEWLQNEAERSEWHLQRAIDAWYQQGDSAASVIDALGRARALADRAGDEGLRDRIALHGCLMAPADPGFRCTPEQARARATRIGQAQIPARVTEASWLLARVQEQSGRMREAQAELESLIGEVAALRGGKPGALGAWYWENRNAIASLYLDVMLRRSGVSTRGFVDGLQVLAALEWVRTLGASDRHEGGGAETAVVAPSTDQLQSWLTRLKNDQRVLSYYFSGQSVYALLADSRRVRVRELDQGPRILRQLAALHDALQAGDDSALAYLQTLGRLMLEPLASELSETLFFAPAGPMNGLPLDAFLLNGAFVAERHRVINSLSISAVARQLPTVPEGFGDRVFLAGRPQDSQRLFEYDLQVSPEVARLTDRFVGPGLHVVQGVALHRDEFRDERFADAHLIHLASPGMMNLASPDQSLLRLSGTEDDPGSGLVYSADVRALPQSAALVTLSGTGTRGQSTSGFDRRLGLVSDFLDTGAGAVVASLWPLPQESVASFMDAFYDALDGDRDVLQALVRVRRERIARGVSDEFQAWAGFQLYIR